MDLWKWPCNVWSFCHAVKRPLDVRVQDRLPRLLLGALLAKGRRTVTSWLRAVRIGKNFRRYYDLLGCVGRAVSWCALAMFHVLLEKVSPGERWLFAIDDTPTKRYGLYVEGAGRHRRASQNAGVRLSFFR